MVQFVVTVEGDEEIRRLATRLPREVYGAMRVAFTLSGNEHVGAMQKRVGRDGPLRRRTGRLANSFRTKTMGRNLPTLEMRSYTGSPYAKTHEFGATIRPTKSENLAIPIRDGLTSAGVRKFPSTARAIQKLGQKAHWYHSGTKRLHPIQNRTQLFGQRRRLQRNGRGSTFLVDPTGRRWKFYAVLKKSVQVPARLEFFRTWRRLSASRLRRNNKALRAALQVSSRGTGVLRSLS